MAARKRGAAASVAAAPTAPAAVPALDLSPVGEPVNPERVRPLVITAELSGRIALPTGPLALDALLGWAVCARADLPPALRTEDLRPVEIPIAKEPSGRFHLASFSVSGFDRFGIKWINRRFPLSEAQGMAESSLRRIAINAGPCKSYRIPLEAGHVDGDQMRWFAMGDKERIEDLIRDIRYLGKRRAVGLGRVIDWDVDHMQPWPGFPVVSPNGKALRTLPHDWPGLVEPSLGYRVLSMPYWRREAEELCAMTTGEM